VSSRAEHIKTVLESNFQPTELEIIDDSWKHAGHAGAKEHGGGHFSIEIVAEIFAGKNRLQRHRMVYAALEKLFGSAIHAVNIRAITPAER